MELIHHLMQQLLEVIGHWGYAGIFILMTLESTFVPVPSELVIPPAAYLAATTGEMNLFMVILMGTLGSILGASFNYGLAVFLGRPFLVRYGKYVLCPPHKFEKMEKFFLTHGEFGTFTGRLMLGIRHFISFPAGLARMKLSHFVGLTAAGSAIWCAVLAAIGWYIGKASANMSHDEVTNLFKTKGKLAALVAAGVCLVLIVAYVWRHRRKKSATEG